MTFKTPLVVGAFAFMAMSTSATADAEADAAIMAASPYMHHSCRSIIETYEDDPERIREIVRMIAIVSLVNRKVSEDLVEQIKDNSDELKEAFIENLRKYCGEDKARMLSGAIDLALRDTLELPPV